MDTRDAGKLGGQSKSPAKQEASRRNGAKGGRPKKPLATNPWGAYTTMHQRYETKWAG